jgi:hypothetical protein
MRMKAHMLDHVRGEAAVMFKRAADTVRESLRQMNRDVEASMADYTDAVFAEMRKDYMNVIAGVKLPEGYVMPRAESLMKEKVAKKLKVAEAMFLAEPNEEDVEMESGGDGCRDGGDVELEDGVDVPADAITTIYQEPLDTSRLSLTNDDGATSTAHENANKAADTMDDARENMPMPDVDDAENDLDFQISEGPIESQSK